MASNCTLGIQNLVKTTLNNKPWFQYDQSLGIVNILDSFTKKINKENSHGVAKTTAITINKQINDGYKNIGDIAFVKSNKEGRGYIDIAPTINQIYLINAQDEKEIYELQKELDEERETEYFEKRSEYSNEYINDDGDLVSKEDLNNFQEEQRELDKIVADINNLEDETKSDILQVGNSSLNQTIKPGVQGTLFQVKNIFNSIKELEEKLSSLNKTSNSIGSNKNLDDILKKAGIESNLRKEFIQLLEDNKSLKSLKLSEVLSSYLKEFIKESDRQYYKAIDEPLSQELENTLIQYFDKFHIRRKELDNLKEKFGVDSIGVFDVLAKTIYYSKNRNLLTLPEEYGHVFVELLGSIGNKKADNPLFKYMFDNIDSWDGYQRVYRDYKNIYLTAEGNTDIYKIKKEAIGQAIGIALVRNYKVQKGDKDFWGKIQEIIDYILNLIKGIDYVSLNTTVDNIAKDILSKNYSKLDRLKKDTSNYSLLSYSETIKNQNKIDGGKALKFMQWFSQKGMIITGSLAYRLQGNVYRPEIDALHDIDNIVPSDIHGVNLLKENFLNSEQLEQDKLYRKYITEGNYNEAKKYKIQGNLKLNLEEQVDKIQVLKDFKLEFPDTDFLYSFYNQKANAYYVTINAIWSENKELKDRFKSYSGSFNSRLENFTKEELEQIYLFDFFLRPETTDHFKKIEDKEYGLSLAHFNYSFYEKLNMMGRPKDAFDYQMWDYNDENNILAPDFNDRLVYFQIDQSKKENTSTDQIKPGVEELFESNPELANAVYEALGFQGSISLESNLKNTGKTEKELTDYLKNKYPEIKLNITNNPLWEISDNVFNQLIQDDYFEGNPKYVTEVERISNLILNKLKFKTREFNGKYDESITDLQTYKTKVLNDLLKEIGITGVVTNLNELKERLNSKELQTSLKENLGQVKESKENFNNQLGNFYSIKRLLNNYLKHLDLSKYDSSQQATIKKHLNNLFKDNKFKSEKQAIAFNKRRINSEEWANKVFNLDKITLGFLGNNAREKKIETLLNYFKIEPKDAAERIYVTIENELNRRERFFTSEKTQAKINAKIAEEKIKLDNEKAERERIRTKELNKFKESTVVSEVEGIIGGRNIHSLEKVLESESINEELAIIKNNGYSLDKTPNGKKSNLYESILALPEVNGNTEIANKLKSLIYSNNFTNWFGDWVNNPEESSKIVDENGEPKLVYHGSGREYNKFSEEKRGSATGKWKDRLSDSEMSFMFTDNPSVAFYYAIIERQQILGEILYYVRKAGQEPTQQLITEMYEKYPSIKYWVNSLKEKGLEKTEILEEFKRIYREYSEIRELSEGGAIGNSNSYLNNMRTAISYLQENKSKILKNGFSKDIGKSTTAKVPNLGKHHTVFLYSSKEYRTSYILADGRLTGFEDKSLNDKNIKDLSSEEYDKIVLQFQEDYVYLYNKIEDELKAGGFQPKIYPVFLNAKSVNSKDFKGRPFMFQEGDTEELVKNRKSKGAAFEVADLVEEALNSGLGGSIIENIADPNVGTNYSVFKANQIKSIFNEEEYSSKNDSFYNQLVNGRIVGQANIKAMTVLVDAVNKKEDTIPHEYAHHYIAWFRNTPIVQEAIKRFGSEEALVQAIGEQVVKQKGEAYNWWKKFTNWILSLLSDKQLLQILTDSFLNRQNLNNFTYNNVGTEQVKKFAELQERLNNKEFLEGAKNAFESSEELQNVYYEAAGFSKQINEIADTKKVDEFIKKYKEALPNIKDGKTLISHLQTISNRNTGTTKQFADLIIKLSQQNKSLEKLLNNPNLYAKPDGVGDEGAFHWSLFNNLSVNKIVLELDHFKTNTYDDVFLHELIHNLTTQFIVKDSNLFNQDFYNKVKELYSVFDNHLENNRKVNEPLLKSTKEDIKNIKRVIEYFNFLPSDAIQQELIFGKIGSISTIKNVKLDFKSLENKSKKDVLQELNILLGYKENRVEEIEKGDKDYYYFNSKTFKQENVLSEFLATFMNNAEFREQLKNIDYKNNKSLFQKIVDLVGDFLGLTKNESLYNEFILNLTKFINNNDYSSVAKQTIKTAYENRINLLEQQKQDALNAYTDYLARVSLGIIKNPSSGEYNYYSKVKDIVYHFSNVKIDKPDKEKFTLSANINRRKGFFGISKNINPGNNFANVEGTIPHAMLFDMKNPDFGDFSIIPPIVAKDDSKDSAIIKQRGDIDYYSVFEPEQIHILGSKQDVEGFKEFLSDTQKTEDYFNEEIKKIQKESKTIDEKISKFESTQKIDNKNTSKALQNMQEKVKIIGDKLLSLGFESINEKEHDFKTSSYITFKSKLKELENLDIDINTFKSPDYLIKTKIKSFKNNFNSQKQGELPFNPIELKIALSENEFIKDIADNTFEGLTDEQIKILKENLDKGEFNLNCKI